MIVKTVTYRNIFDKEVTRDLYCGLTKAEVLHLEADWAKRGGISGVVDEVQRGEDVKLIMDTFRELIARSYGERRDDEFMKTPEITAKFLASDAYSELLMGLVSKEGPENDPMAFMRGILPQNVDLNDLDADESQVARQRSEANMQGHQKAAPVLKTAPPILSKEPDVSITSEDDPAWAAEQHRMTDATYQEFLAFQAAKAAQNN